MTSSTRENRIEYYERGIRRLEARLQGVRQHNNRLVGARLVVFLTAGILALGLSPNKRLVGVDLRSRGVGDIQCAGGAA